MSSRSVQNSRAHDWQAEVVSDAIMLQPRRPVFQDLKNKAGEVKFRAKLFQRQVEGSATLDGELTSAEMLNEMRRRI